MHNNLEFEIVKREELYKGLFSLARYHIRHKLFNGGTSETYTREVFERPSAAAVLPYDPILDRVILIEQFRAGSVTDPETPWLLEIPAGIILHNATPEEVAHQEAFEEAGCTVSHLTPICDYYCSPGGSNEFLNLYCGKVDASNVNGVHGLANEHEDIRVHNISYIEAIEKFSHGKIKTSPAIIALLWLQLNRERLRNLWK